MVYFQYHLNCQYITDNGGDNEISQKISVQWIVFASEIIRLDEVERIWDLFLPQLAEYMVYFQYHLNCQYFTDNGGDNEIRQKLSAQWIFFAFEIICLDEVERIWDLFLPQLA